MILQLENISKSFGKKNVLKNISFSLQSGTLTAIVGENGAGKSTLMKIIVGEIKADSGSIKKNGKVGYCPQDTILFEQSTVLEHFNYFASAYAVNHEILDDQIEKLVDHFNFRKYKKTRVDRLSGGTKQKLNLSLALLHKPKLLVLDEPYNGFDWNTYQKFWDYTKQLKKRGCAVLVVSHLINEKDIFDRIYQLDNGSLK